MTFEEYCAKNYLDLSTEFWANCQQDAYFAAYLSAMTAYIEWRFDQLESG